MRFENHFEEVFHSSWHVSIQILRKKQQNLVENIVLLTGIGLIAIVDAKMIICQFCYFDYIEINSQYYGMNIDILILKQRVLSELYSFMNQIGHIQGQI